MSLFGKKYDFVAIGDVVTDAFIRLKDASTHCKLDHTACELCVRFGDKVPFESVEVIPAVGNSPNASVSASRLGLKSALLAVVGDDKNGHECLEALRKNNVSTQYIDADKTLPTNYHYVLWYDVDRTILVNHSPFERHLPKNMKAPKWMYLSSLGENTLDFHNEIADFLEKNKDTKLAFQPGTFQIKIGSEKLSRIYKRTDVFFCNVEEAQKILNLETRDLPTLLEKMHGLGPKTVVITDGIDGAYVREENGRKFFMPVYPHKPVERTGAGDAFASTVTSVLAMGKSIDEALRWAPVNAMSVTQFVGAQKGLLTKAKIQELLSRAPADYKLKEL